MILRVTHGDEILNDYELAEGEYVIGSSDSTQLKIESSCEIAGEFNFRKLSGPAERPLPSL